MQPIERIRRIARREPVDRPGIDYYSTPEFTQIFKDFLGVADDEALLRRIGCDIRRVDGKFVGPQDMLGVTGISDGGRDFFGVVWKPVKNRFATYNEIAFHPLGHVTTVREVEEYAWPSPDWWDYSNLKNDIARINRDERYCILFFVGGAFESPWYMRGLERFLMDLVECPDIAEAISRKCSEFFHARALRAIEAADGAIDMIYSGGDIGTQRGMMLNPDLWRKHIKPYATPLLRTFKDMGLITMYHSCGSIIPVIDDLIEMGLDILDPIQPKARDMSPENLKALFGGRLSFHGGIDEQELLPRGTPEQVRAETERIIGVFGADGGYIVCSAHAFQADTPPENALAMYEAAMEYRF
jgi:uroporphyrinogen decarboxylase